MVKRVDATQTTDTSNLLKKLAMTQTLVKLKKKLLNMIIVIYDKYVPKLAQANLASKNDIAAFVKKTDFDDKLKNLDKKSYFKLKKMCRG